VQSIEDEISDSEDEDNNHRHHIKATEVADADALPEDLIDPDFLEPNKLSGTPISADDQRRQSSLDRLPVTAPGEFAESAESGTSSESTDTPAVDEPSSTSALLSIGTDLASCPAPVASDAVPQIAVESSEVQTAIQNDSTDKDPSHSGSPHNGDTQAVTDEQNSADGVRLDHLHDPESQSPSPPSTPSGIVVSQPPSPRSDYEASFNIEQEEFRPTPFILSPNGIGVTPVDYVPVVLPHPLPSPRAVRTDAQKAVIEVAEGAVGLEDLDKAQIDEDLELETTFPCFASFEQDPLDPSRNTDSSPLSSAPDSQSQAVRGLDIDSLLCTTSPYRSNSSHKARSDRSVSSSTISSLDDIGETTVGGEILQQILPKQNTFAEQVVEPLIAATPEQPSLAEYLDSQARTLSDLENNSSIENPSEQGRQEGTPPPTSSTRLAEALLRSYTSTSPVSPHFLLLPPRPDDRVKQDLTAVLHTGHRGSSSSLSPVPSSALQRIIESLSPSGSRAGPLALDLPEPENTQDQDDQALDFAESAGVCDTRA
jgi:hypothetical protein